MPEGESFLPLYTTILGLAVVADVCKHLRKIRRSNGDSEMVTITINFGRSTQLRVRHGRHARSSFRDCHCTKASIPKVTP
jgi:hypothetical protein